MFNTPRLRERGQAKLQIHEKLIPHLQRAGVVIVYSIMGLAANWPILPGNSTAMRQGDPTEVTWNLVWSPWSILHGHNPFFTDYVNYPRGINLAQNTAAPLLGWVTAPLTFWSNSIASLNLLQWLAFTLTACSMFYVLRRWTSWRGAAFVGGTLYGFSPYMVGQGLDHMVINFLPLPPLIFLCFYELIVRQEVHAKRWGFLLGFCELGQFLISPEVAVTCLIVGAIGAAVLALAKPKHIIPALHAGMAGLLIAGIIVLLGISYPVWVMIAGPYHYVGTAHPGGLSADLASSILPTQMQRFAPSGWIAHGTKLVGGDYPENTSYLGIPLIMLMIIIVIRYRRDAWIRFSAFMVFATFVLSLGPRLQINNHFTSIPLPYSWVQGLPLLSNLLSVRITMYEFFFAAILLAIALDRWHSSNSFQTLSRSFHRPLNVPSLLCNAALAMLTAATIVSLIPRWPYPSYPADVPTYFSSDAVKRIPQGAVVLISPYPSVAEVLGQQWQAIADMRFKIIGGYGLFTDPNGAADTYPAKLSPTDVESYLWAYATGGAPYPDKTVPSDNKEFDDDVRNYLVRYHVNAVLAVGSGANPTVIANMFSGILGPPSQVYGNVDIWYQIPVLLRLRSKA